MTDVYISDIKIFILLKEMLVCSLYFKLFITSADFLCKMISFVLIVCVEINLYFKHKV